jgi:hypothetical protein
MTPPKALIVLPFWATLMEAITLFAEVVVAPNVIGTSRMNRRIINALG